MLHFHENRPPADSGLGPGHGWRPLARGVRDWRTQMAPDEVERFEAAAGELLDQLSYHRAFPKPRPETVAEAIHIRKLLANESLNVRPYELERTR